MLAIHLISALLSGIYGATTLFNVFRGAKLHVGRSALILGILLALSVTSGLALAVSVGASVLSVCDNIALYITFFAVVYATIGYRYGRRSVITHLSWSFAYATLTPIVLIVLGF